MSKAASRSADARLTRFGEPEIEFRPTYGQTAAGTLACGVMAAGCLRFVLCGTPAPNAPQDLVQQFNIVDSGITFSGVNIPDGRDAARQVVQRAIDERGLFIRHLKVDVLPDLPAKQFHRVIVPFQPDQQRLYSARSRI